MLKFFNILFLILFLNGCGNGETSHADGQPIAPMANDGSYQLALDNSLVKYRLGFPCKYLAVSGNSTGQALAYVDSNWNVPILLYPGYSGLVNAKESLYLDVGPQPGKMLQLFFGDEPIVSSPAAKFSSDPSLTVLSYINFKQNTVGIDQIVSAANNVNGIKILGGSVSATAVSVGAGWTGYDLSGLQINQTEFIALANVYSATALIAGMAISQIDHIPQFIIPPGMSLDWNHNGTISGQTIQSFIVLNYQIL